MAPYSATKTGVVSVTETTGAEWADDSLRVNPGSPVPVGTDRVKGWFGIEGELDREDPSLRVGGTDELTGPPLVQ